MKRRLLAVLLTAGLVLSMTACGGKSEKVLRAVSEDTSATDAGAVKLMRERPMQRMMQAERMRSDISIAVNLKTLNSEYWGT